MPYASAMDLSPVHDLLQAGYPLIALRVFLSIVDAHIDAGPRRTDIDAETQERLQAAIQALLKSFESGVGHERPAGRVLPDLNRRLQSLRVLGPQVALLALKLDEAIRRHQDVEAGANDDAPHFLALLELVDFRVGLPVQISWYPRSEAHDDASTQLDDAGRQQVGTAGKVLLALVDRVEVAGLKAFNKNRLLLALLRLDMFGSVEGASLGLPVFLAMVAEWFKLQPAVGTAAMGELDISKLPTSHGTGRFAATTYQNYLDMPILPVGGIAAKLRAALETGVRLRRILVPEGNRVEIEADPGLMADIDSTQVDIVYVGCIGDVFGEPSVFSATLYAPPLRLDPQLTEDELVTTTRWAYADLVVGALLAGTLTSVLLGFI